MAVTLGVVSHPEGQNLNLEAFRTPLQDDLRLNLNQLTGTIPPELATNKNLSKLSEWQNWATLLVHQMSNQSACGAYRFDRIAVRGK